MNGVLARKSTAAPSSGSATLRRLLILAAVLIALLAATPLAFAAGGDNAYMGFALATGLVALAATRTAEHAPTPSAFWLIIVVALLARGALLFTDPLLSTDIYRYVWDGRIQAAGINPYRHVPADEALVALRDAVIYPHINRADYAVTIYPPVAQMFFFLVTRFGEGVTAMKLGLLLCEAGTVTILVLLLRRLGRPVTRVVAYAWHPLPIWEIANSGHIDALMIALMMTGIWLALGGRRGLGAVAITLGILAKPFAAPALAVAWRPWDWKLPLLVALVALLCYAPYLSLGWGVFGFLATGYVSEEQLNTGDSVWLLALWRLIVGTLPGDVIVYFATSALALVGMGVLTAQMADRSACARLAALNKLLLLFLFLMPLNYPWYFLVATPFVALTGGAPVWVITLGAVLLQKESWGDWQMPLQVRKSILYGAFLASCAFAAWQARRVNATKVMSNESADTR